MKLLVAGGGTGGHLFPGIAVAEELLTRRPGSEALFVGTRRGIEARVLPELGYRVEFIHVRGLKGTGLRQRVVGLARLPHALVESLRILRRFGPDVVVGVGGYASGPAVLAARLLGLPTLVLEQNSVPGVTNRILGRVADRVVTAFPPAERHFPPGKVLPLGNPVRRELLDNYLRSRDDHEDRFEVLVLGGSQGAAGVNRLVVEAAAQVGPSVRWVHQTGTRHEAAMRQAHSGREQVEVVPFIDDMSAAYRRADLVVGRAGATTIAELTVARKPSLLLPFPHAADNHQELNARVLVEAGAALMFREAELTGAELARTVQELAADPARVARMEQAAASLGRPEAAREIVDACEDLVRGRGRLLA